MGRDQWNALSEMAKSTWDTLDDSSKAIILGYNKHTSKTSFPKTPHPAKLSTKTKPALKPPTRTVHFHDVETTDNDNGETKEQDEQQECQDCMTEDDEKDVILTHITKRTSKPNTKSAGSQSKKNQPKLPPGNIQRLLGST